MKFEFRKIKVRVDRSADLRRGFAILELPFAMGDKGINIILWNIRIEIRWIRYDDR